MNPPKGWSNKHHTTRPKCQVPDQFGALSAHSLHVDLLCSGDLRGESLPRAALGRRDHHVRLRACVDDGEMRPTPWRLGGFAGDVLVWKEEASLEIVGFFGFQVDGIMIGGCYIYIYIYMVIDLKVLVRSFNCESLACYVGNPRESFFSSSRK